MSHWTLVEGLKKLNLLNKHNTIFSGNVSKTLKILKHFKKLLPYIRSTFKLVLKSMESQNRIFLAADPENLRGRWPCQKWGRKIFKLFLYRRYVNIKPSDLNSCKQLFKWRTLYIIFWLKKTTIKGIYTFLNIYSSK